MSRQPVPAGVVMKYLSVVLVMWFLPLNSIGATEGPQLLREAYFSNVTTKERGYFVYLPNGFAARERWPVILFLHGNGERGDGLKDLDFVMVHGPLYEAWIQKRDLPFVIIAPQLPVYDQGDDPSIKFRKPGDAPRRLQDGVPERAVKFPADEPMSGSKSHKPDVYGIEGPPFGWSLHAEELIRMVDKVIDDYRGDPDRVYLTGLSYGGYGTWYLASKYPDRFAAAVPIVGYAHPGLIDSIARARMPVWCFAGGRDPVVPVKYFYAGMNKLEKLSDADIRFTVEEDMNHDVWTRVYAGEDIYNWMLSHTMSE
jgi:predicted peptidase